MRILVTRPRPDAEVTAEKLRGMGHEAVVAPLLEIDLYPSAVPPLDGAQALIVTSRNALRALDARGLSHAEKERPVFAVGGATARMARESGFSGIRTGEGTAELLLPLIVSNCKPDAGPLIHLAGEKTAWDLKGAIEAAGFTVEQPVVYRAVPANTLPEPALDALGADKVDGVMLMSPETAKIYVALLAAHGIGPIALQVRHFCLSQAVAAELSSLPEAGVEVAGAPTQDALLALVGPDAAN
jgi:uroporphyrinogen-III synthase